MNGGDWHSDTSLLERLGLTIPRYAGWIIAASVVITALMLTSLPRLKIHNAAEKYALPPDDPESREMADFEKRFGNGESIVVAVTFAGAIGAPEMRTVMRLTERLGAVDGVARVWSLANAQRVHWVLGSAVFAPLVDVDEADAAVIDAAVRWAAATEPYAETFVSRDRRSAAMVVDLERIPDSPELLRRKRTIVAGLRAALEPEQSGFERAHIAGTSLIDLAFEDNLRLDLGVFGGLSAGLALAVLLLLFRDWRPVALASLCAGMSLTWSLGIVAIAAVPVSIGLAMIVPLMLVVSVAYSIHYLAFLSRPEHAGRSPETIAAMLRDVFPPSVLTGATTAAGFLALSSSGLQGVREVGLFLAVGVIACAFISSVFLVALLSRFPRLAGAPSSRMMPSERMAGWLAHLVVHSAAIVTLVTGALVVLSLEGTRRLRVDSNHLFYFRESEPVRRDYAEIDRALGGAVPLEILVETPVALLNRTALGIARLMPDLRAVPGIGSAVSITDLLEDPARGEVQPLAPDAWEAVAESPFGARFIHIADSVAALRIAVRAHVQGTMGLDTLLRHVQATVDRHAPSASVTVTGLVPIFVRTLGYIVRSQTWSFGLAFATIFALIIALTRSLSVGAIAAMANLVPILLVLGAMGWLDIPLDIATVMIGSVIIGIAVDDTIHFLFRYMRARRAGAGVDESLRRTFAKVGSPLVASTLVLCGGFLVLVPSQFVPISYFGLLSALTVIAALLADVLLLPALLRLMPRRA